MKTKRIIVSCLLILAIYSCKKKENTTIELSGKWFAKLPWDTTATLNQEYYFKPDATLEIIASVVDNKSKETKGYVSKVTGTYSYKGDSLILRDQKVISTGSHTYKDLNDLNYTYTLARSAYKPIYNSTKDTLILVFHCPIFADCTPFPRLTRTN